MPFRPLNVLLYTPRRDIRRAAFDALEDDGTVQIIAARDARQLEAMLADAPPIDVVVTSAELDDDHLTGLRMLPGVDATAHAPVVTVVPDGPLTFAPDGAKDWLRESAIPSELVQRVRAARAPAPGADAPADEPDFRFAFDAGAAWVVASVPDHTVLWAGEAMQRLCAGEPPIEGRRLDELLQLDDGSSWPVPDTDGAACTLRRADGSTVPGTADVRHLVEHGTHRLAVGFRDGRAAHVAHHALGLLASMDVLSPDDEALQQAARRMAHALSLDALGLWSALAESETGLRGIARLQSNGQPWPASDDMPLLRAALGGQPTLHLGAARDAAAGDPLADSLQLAAYAALPLLDERRNVIGVMFAGRRHAASDAMVLDAALRACAARFAAALDVRRARAESSMSGLSDALTGLPNRLLFHDRLGATIRDAERTDERFAVMLVDLDRFKGINETLGMRVGDQVLAAVARRLRACVRGSDTVARYAGDEFAMILRHIVQRDDALRVAEKVARAMEAPLTLDDGSELQTTVSVGIAFFGDASRDGDTLVRHADEAMRGAKRLGRNNYQMHAAGGDDAQQQNNELKSRLRHAERNGELRVFYQPQVDAASEDIVGMEALVRWEHPELGMISPGLFIPQAEATGLIVPIGHWVLRTACLQACEWQRQYRLGLRLGVNLSAVQLMQPDLVQTVAEALRDSGLDPALLELEVTESISVKAVPRLVETLEALHGLGCRIAIDDFGTGAASLDYLRRFPADRIKIDQSFVRNIGIDPDDEAIVRATIDMAHRLKRGVVAEGVELEQHLDFLRANGCDELQGYLFCRPLPVGAFDKLLADRAVLHDQARFA
jgi:diguanylate cyclase (GGDEF)-like protein